MFGGWRMRYPPPKLFITFPGPLRSITVKENHIGSVVSKILLSLIILYIIEKLKIVVN